MKDNRSCDEACKVNENKLGRIIQIMPVASGWRQAQVFREVDESGDCKKNGKPFLIIRDVVAWALVESRDACGCISSTVLPMVQDEDGGDGLVVSEFIGGESRHLASSILIAPGEIVKLRDGADHRADHDHSLDDLLDVSRP